MSKLNKVDVLIIGAGWSGLYAAKYAKAEGLRVKILEARDDLGGVWNYSESKDIITVMKNTISSSSRNVTEASDFGMSSKAGNFMRHQDVMEYLRDYANHFNLNEDIIFNSRIVSADKNEKHEWEVTTENGEKYYSTNLVVCCGVHQTKRKIDEPVSSFSGNIYHAGDFKHFENFNVSKEDHVIVYGGGETASDVIDELVKKPCQITWAIKGGQHFFRKAPLRPNEPVGHYDRWDNALDAQSTIIHRLFTNFQKSKPGMRYGCNLASSGSVFSYQGHGIKAWQNDIPWYHDFFNKNGHALEYVWANRVIAKPGIKSCNDRLIKFEDGTTTTATHIICCFGYKPLHSFLPDWAKSTPTYLMYKLVFHPDDPSLSFIGYARPTITSIPYMAEVQCMWASKVWRGKFQLPAREIMHESAKTDLKKRKEFFPNYSNQNIVDPKNYVQDILSFVGINSLNKLLTKDYQLLLKILVSPSSPIMLRILMGQYSEKEIERLEEYTFPTIYFRNQKGKKGFLNSHLWFFLNGLIRIGLMRLISIDRIFDFIAKWKMAKYGTSMDDFRQKYPSKVNNYQPHNQPDSNKQMAKSLTS